MLTKYIKVLRAPWFLLAFAQPASALYLTPHIGVDYKYWGVPPAENGATKYYVNIFPEITNAGTIYIGTRINKNWGIDFGFDHSSNKHLSHTFNVTQYVFSSLSNVNDSTQINMQLSAYYVSFLFYWEVMRNLELVFDAGVASLQPKSNIQYNIFGAGPVTLQFSTPSKYSGRFGFGAQYLFAKYFGARALVTFDQTRRIEFVGYDQYNVPFDIFPYKKATSFNLGVFAEWGVKKK